METNKNINLDKNSKGLIFSIGTRRSNNYYQIYQGPVIKLVDKIIVMASLHAVAFKLSRKVYR